jgi:hypothetical protein
MKGNRITDLATPGAQFSDAFGINNINSDPSSLQIVGRNEIPGGPCNEIGLEF